MPQANIQPDKFYTVKGVQLLPLGKVRDSEGREHDFTDDRLAGIAQRYKPTVGGHEARVSIDHAKKGRAHARVPEVYHVPGEGLFGNYADVPGTSAKDFVYYGGFPFRSPELIDFNGGEYVGTITHLGAQRPACKGMRSILPDQIVEQDSPGSEMGEVESGGVWLFSEDPPTIKLQENDDMDGTELAEQLGQTKAELAEETKARELAEAKEAQTAKEFAEYKAAQTHEIKLGEAKGKALEFAESAEIKPKLGAVKGDRLAAAIAHGNLNCPQIEFDGKSLDFGEFVQGIIAEMPDGSAPNGKPNLGEGKPKGDTGDGGVKFSERTLARIEEKRVELGEDSKEFKAYCAAAEEAQRELSEGVK